MSAARMNDATKARPIIFSAPMVRAILEGRKTQTRRLIKPQPPEGFRSVVRDCDCSGSWWFTNMPKRSGVFSMGEIAKWGHCYPKCPYGKPGDLLWVRESYYDRGDYAIIGKCRDDRIVYVADGVRAGWKIHTPIFMPRWASRITLRVTRVRVERVQEISEQDAIAEGVERCNSDCTAVAHRLVSGSIHCDRYARLWDQLHAKHPWASNPWVWVVEFERQK